MLVEQVRELRAACGIGLPGLRKLLETGALVWLTATLTAMFATAAESLAAAEQAKQAESRLLEAQVEQGRRHDKEAAGLIKVPRLALPTQVPDELISDQVQGQFGDFKLVLGDQRQQQVEWAIEIAHPNREALGRACGRIS